MDVRDELIQVAAVATAMVSLIDKYSTGLAFDEVENAQFDHIYVRIAEDVIRERLEQERKWGVRYEDDDDVFWWLSVLGEEVGEACEAALEAKADASNWYGWPNKDDTK